jgi:predicted transcriptional regulator
MAARIPSLGDLEIRVLRLVWELQPCTERQVSDFLMPEKKVARTTVLKTIQRLEAKGMIARVPAEGAVRFKAVLDRNRILPMLVRQFVDTVLGGSTDPLVAYLADQGKLSAKDLAALSAIARKIRSTE